MTIAHDHQPHALSGRDIRLLVAILVLLLTALVLTVRHADWIDGVETAPAASPVITGAAPSATAATPPHLRFIAAAPVCESPLAVLSGKEILVLRRTGSAVAALVVVHDGADRGVLFTVDLETRTLRAPMRPPAGWSIGGSDRETGR